MTGYKSKKEMAQAKLENDDDIKTYTRPWVGLTNEDIFAAVKDLYNTDKLAFMGRIDDIATARAIEAALRSKNT